MRFVLDENCSPQIVRVLLEFKVDAAHTTTLWEPGMRDTEIASKLEVDDVFVTFDRRLLGRLVEVEAFRAHRCKVLSIRAPGLRLREQVGLLLLWASDLMEMFSTASPPCVVKITKHGPGDLTEIVRPPVAYGTPPIRGAE